MGTNELGVGLGQVEPHTQSSQAGLEQEVLAYVRQEGSWSSLPQSQPSAGPTAREWWGTLGGGEGWSPRSQPVLGHGVSSGLSLKHQPAPAQEQPLWAGQPSTVRRGQFGAENGVYAIASHHGLVGESQGAAADAGTRGGTGRRAEEAAGPPLLGKANST